MPERIFFTSANGAYLPKVAVLARSLKERHPEAHFVLLFVDEPTNLPDGYRADAGIDEVLFARELYGDDFERWVFGHSVVEACTAAKADALVALMRRPGVESVTYLDPDVRVVGSFDPLFAMHEKAAVVLTPHLTAPEPNHDGVFANEVTALFHGTYNLGFVSVAASDSGLAVVDWWAQRLRDYCVDDLAGGLFTDQKWMELAPALFDSVVVCRDPGMNVATWNISSRHLAREADGALTSNGAPVVFLHFSGFDSGRHTRALERAGRHDALFGELSAQYARETAEVERRLGKGGEWAYATYDDGTPITLAERREYRFNELSPIHYPEPFRSGDGSFQVAYQHAHGSPLQARGDEISLPTAESRAASSAIAELFESGTLKPGRLSRVFPPMGKSVEINDGAYWARRDVHALRVLLDPRLSTVAMLTLQGGGCAAHVRQLSALCGERLNVIHLCYEIGTSGVGPRLSVRFAGASGATALYMDPTLPGSEVTALIRELGVDFVHLHHRFGLESVIDRLPEAFPGCYGVTLHDYAFMSPEPHLAGIDGCFVGLPSAVTWDELEQAGAVHRGRGAAGIDHSNAYLDLLREAVFVISPSHDCARRVAEILPDLEVTVHAHWEPGVLPEGDRVRADDRGPAVAPRIAIPGEFIPTKGARVVCAVAAYAQRMGVPVQFVALGDAPPIADLEVPSNVKLLGGYAAGEFADVLLRVGATVVWLPSQVPETYSYAVSEAMRSGLPVVVSDLGALPERVERYPVAVVSPWDGLPRQWLDALLQANTMPRAFDCRLAVAGQSDRFYPDVYVESIRGAVADAGRPTSE